MRIVRVTLPKMYCLSSSQKDVTVNSSFISCKRCRRLPPFFSEPPKIQPQEYKYIVPLTVSAVFIVFGVTILGITLKRKKRQYDDQRAQNTANLPSSSSETAQQEEVTLPLENCPPPEREVLLAQESVSSDKERQLDDNDEVLSDRHADEAHRSLTSEHLASDNT
ncbi:uncharacterized protein [Ptychodera flava]|uniref:uncharacterized protein n=1 Tax=Ptychodera flava TaxID=63121 RepID=UPI00396A6048